MNTYAFALLLSFVAPLQSREETFFKAAREGDLETVKSLVAAGVPVDAKTKYGATALSYACDKGHRDVVLFLLERGADVNATDTFYKATPLGWALSNDHLDLAKILLKRGASGAGQALVVGAGKGDAELVKLALETGTVNAELVASAVTAAERAGAKEIKSILEAANVKPAERAAVAVDPSVLRSYEGFYKSDDGFVVRVSLKDGSLVAEAPGRPPIVLAATDPSTFEAVGVVFTFSGRGGMVERVAVKQGESTMVLPRVSSEDVAPRADVKAPAATEPRREPGAPRPWPSFRGENGSGVADGQSAPLTWNAESGAGIRWKTPIPGIANSSPIVWGDRVFVTTAVSSSGDATFRTGLYGDVNSVDDLSKHSFRVYALERQTGKILWEKIAEDETPEVKRHLKSSLANSTPATNGERVVAFFGAIGLLVCYDVTGIELWRRRLGAMDSGWFYDPSYQWGFASSPVLYRDLVIIQADRQKESFIGAYDLKTGNEVWRTAREDEISTWGTPALVADREPHEIVTNGTKIRGYEAATGKLLWTLKPNSEVTVATPVVGKDLVYVTAGYPPVRPIYAIRPGGRGDLSLADGQESSEWIKWSKTRGGTYIPTPVLYGDLLYLFANDGRLSAYEAATGALVYQARVGTEGAFSASPIASDGRLYFTSETGKTFVVRAGRAFEILAENDIGEVVMSTPALSAGTLVVRTLGHVFGISQ